MEEYQEMLNLILFLLLYCNIAKLRIGLIKSMLPFCQLNCPYIWYEQEMTSAGYEKGWSYDFG